MSDFEIITKNGDAFVVDWDIIERLLKSVYTIQYQLIESQINPLKSNEFNPRMDALWTVDVDWDTVKAKTARDIRLEMPDLRSWAKSDPAGVARELDHRVDFAGGLRQDFLDKLRWVSSRNKQNIDKAVDAYQTDINLLKLVRDTAADLFIVAASIETGGAAAEIYTTVGSAGKGFAKYQDTRSYAAAVLEGCGTFVFSAVKIKGSTPFGIDFNAADGPKVLAMIQAPYKTYTELVSGKSVAEAVAGGLIKLMAPGLDGFFKKFGDVAVRIFSNSTLPMEITTTEGEDVALPLLTKGASKLTQQLLNKGAKAMSSSNSTATAAPPAPLMDEVTLTNKSLLYHGLYNVNKGPGGGW